MWNRSNGRRIITTALLVVSGTVFLNGSAAAVKAESGLAEAPILSYMIGKADAVAHVKAVLFAAATRRGEEHRVEHLQVIERFKGPLEPGQRLLKRSYKIRTVDDAGDPIPDPGMSLPVENGKEYIVFLKETPGGANRKFILLDRWLGVLPYSPSLAEVVHGVVHSQARAMPSNQSISCAVTAKVIEVDELPIMRGYRVVQVDDEARWMITLDIDPHTRKIPLQPGTRRINVASLSALFGRDVEPKDLTGRRFRFSWTWNFRVPGKPEFERFTATEFKKAPDQSVSGGGTTGDSKQPVGKGVGDPEEQEAAISKLIRELGSPSQKTRDAAAEKLRKSYVPPKRNKWKKLLAGIEPGDSKKEVLQQFAIDPLRQLEFGRGNGPMYMEEYRLDDLRTLHLKFNVAGDTLREAKLVERMQRVWVAPPEDFSGVWITYHVNGQRSHEIHYRNGKYDGTFTTYHSNGAKSVVQNYGPQGIDGKDTGYFPTGEVKYRGFYKSGSPVGTWTWYNKDGSIRTTRRRGVEAGTRPEQDNGDAAADRNADRSEDEATPEIDRLDDKGFSKLHRASMGGKVETARQLLEQGANPNVRQGTFRGTPLQYAAAQGHLEVVRLLLKHDADVDATDTRGRTPLTWAAMKGQTEAATILLKAGADPMLTARDGRRAAAIAADAGHNDRVDAPRKQAGNDPRSPRRNDGGNTAGEPSDKAWSNTVNGLQARITMKEAKGFNAKTRIISGYLTLRNVSDVITPMKVRWTDKLKAFRVIDEAGNELPQPAVAAYSGFIGFAGELVLPFDSSLTFNICGSGGYPKGPGAHLDLGPMNFWNIDQAEGKKYFLETTFKVPDSGQPSDERYWHGTIKIPKVEIPLKSLSAKASDAVEPAIASTVARYGLPDDHSAKLHDTEKANDPPPGSLRLLDGYQHKTGQGKDSLVGRIWRDDGITIHYDIGKLAGNQAGNVAAEDRVWAKRQKIRGRNVLIVKDRKNHVVASFPDPDSVRKLGPYPANFFATVESESELADFLLMVLTYPPAKEADAAEGARHRGGAKAIADIKAGRPAILHYGKPWSVDKPLVDDDTGLPIKIVAGSDVTPEFVAEVRAYNSVIREWHANKLEPEPDRAQTEHTAWLAESLREMQTIKPGMTRADLLKVFQQEGGISNRTQRRYVYRGSPFIKVDVTFEAVGAPEDKLAESPKDKITEISKPFLEGPILDAISDSEPYAAGSAAPEVQRPEEEVAATTSTQLTKETVDEQPFAFSIDVTDRFHQGRELYFRVAVRLTGEQLSPKSRFGGTLQMYDGKALIASCPVSSTRQDGRIVYTFLVSQRFLKDSTFTFGETLGAGDEPASGRYYWFYLGDFAEQQAEEKEIHAVNPSEESQAVNGLQARITMKEKKVFNGTRIISAYLTLRNVSDVSTPMKVKWTDKHKAFRVVDEEGNELLSYNGPYSGFIGFTGELLLPFDSSLTFNICGSGAGVAKGKAAHLDLGPKYTWSIDQAQGKKYFLETTLKAEELRRKDVRYWHGTIKIPKVEIPLESPLAKVSDAVEPVASTVGTKKPQAIAMFGKAPWSDLPQSKLPIEVKPAGRTVDTGKITLPLTITNSSAHAIRTTLAHEWHGGEWPPTDLYISVTPDETEKPAPFSPVYLVGERADETKPSTIAPGKSLRVGLRMDWAGTGSVQGQPLLTPGVGMYRVRMLLVFKRDGKSEYVVGPAKRVRLVDAGTRPEQDNDAAEEPSARQVRGRIVSTEYQKIDGGIERSIVFVYKLPGNDRVVRNYSAGEPFEFELSPGRYRFVFSANGTRGATFQSVRKEIAVPDNKQVVDLGTIDLAASTTTKLFGRKAPELAGIIEWKHSEPQTLEQLRGKVVVLDFWAYYCTICHVHKPDLAKLYAKYRKQGLEVVAIHNNSLESMEAVDERMQKVASYQKLHLPIALDGKGKQSVCSAYGITGVPAVILIDRDGKVVRRFHHAGKPELEKEIARLTAKRVSATEDAKPEGESWGPAVEGLQARLRTGITTWRMGEAAAFLADVRNAGKNARTIPLTQALCELEFDGEVYRWAYPVEQEATPLASDGTVNDIPVVPASAWKNENGKPLNLTAGKHRVRVIFLAERDRRPGEDGAPTRVASNVVEFEVAGRQTASAARENGLDESWIVRRLIPARFWSGRATIRRSDAPVEIEVANKAVLGNQIALALTVTNKSKSTIQARLPHEWHGGLWPPTDLFASVTPIGSKNRVAFHEVFLVGKNSSKTSPTTIEAGESLAITVRMDWPGTGSVRTAPLMNANLAKTYDLRFLLAFTRDGKTEYVAGPETRVELAPAKPKTGEESALPKTDSAPRSDESPVAVVNGSESPQITFRVMPQTEPPLPRGNAPLPELARNCKGALVATLLKVGDAELGPPGAADYAAKWRVTKALRGDYPETTHLSFRVQSLPEKSRERPPAVGKSYILITYETNAGQVAAILDADEENLRKVQGLLRGDEEGKKRTALWQALWKALPEEYKEIDVYAENPSLSQVLFRSQGATLAFSLKTGKVEVVDHMKLLPRINRITFEQHEAGPSYYVLWLNGRRELTIID